MPRTGKGRFGAAMFEEDPSDAMRAWFQQRSVKITESFNKTLKAGLRVRQGVDFWKKRGLIQNWDSMLEDGVHLQKTHQYAFFKCVRGALIHHAQAF